MDIAVIGATGYAGAPIVEEARARGHGVVAISRRGGTTGDRVAALAVDIGDADGLAAALRGREAVIHAFNPGRGSTGPGVFEAFVVGHRHIIAAVRAAGIGRLLCVGGAGSLLTRDDVPLLDSNEWPAEFEPYKDGVRGTRELYYLLQETTDLDWVFVSPSNLLFPGPRTGRYRTGRNHLLYDADGVSRISLADYACAMIDELERPAHRRERFTVGY